MKEINYLLKGLLKPILKNYSPVLIILKRNWFNIIGEKYYEFCEVEKIYFQKNKKNEGTLNIICFNNVISFYIENNKFFIIEKINAIFGYCLIKNLKIKQIPKIVKDYKIHKKRDIDIKIKENLNKTVSHIQNDNLKNALKNLGELVYLNNK